MELNAAIRDAVAAAIEASSDPVAAMQEIVGEMRKVPAGAHRYRCMNTFVRTLGEPRTLATWLDLLRDVYARDGSAGQKICEILLSYKRHSHYGHYQLLMMVSRRDDPAKHAGQWDLLLSIWQPVAISGSFPSARRSEPRLLVEPAHSHPFDFVSKIVAGTMYESTYRRTTREVSSHSVGRYAGTPLVCVDRTWPPHQHREDAWLETVEERVALRAGDSYFLPSDAIHDVEMDVAVSSSTPAITLMLSAESTAVADVYLEQALLEFHDAHPKLREDDAAMPFAIWDDILTRTAAHLRGGSSLQLPRMPIRDSFLMH